jgi:hypothetical protein
MKTQTLAFTTAALLKSTLPFALLSVICTTISAFALLGASTTTAKIVLAGVLVLAMPLAWLSLRLLFDAQIMGYWAQQGGENGLGDAHQALVDFDQSLTELGVLKSASPRDLLARARGCMGLQKKFLLLAILQWVLFLFVLVIPR